MRKRETDFNRGERKGRREGLATKTQRHKEKVTAENAEGNWPLRHKDTEKK